MRRLDCRGRGSLDAGAAAAVAAVARAGGVIAFPTDTLYALGADPFSEEGVAAVFRAKGRARTKPLPVLIAAGDLLGRLAAAVPDPAAALIGAFWPGALTLLLPAREGLPPGIRSAAGEVAVRLPAGGLCRSVLAAAGGLLTGTSANRAGAGGGSDPAEAAAALGEGIDLLLDAGTLPPSAVSSIVRVGEDGRVVVVRDGAVGAGLLRRVLGAEGGGPGFG